MIWFCSFEGSRNGRSLSSKRLKSKLLPVIESSNFYILYFSLEESLNLCLYLSWWSSSNVKIELVFLLVLADEGWLNISQEFSLVLFELIPGEMSSEYENSYDDVIYLFMGEPDRESKHLSTQTMVRVLEIMG